MAISLDEFIRRLTESGLMPPEEVRALREDLQRDNRDEDAEGIARQLVADGKLTQYQAAAVCKGRTKALVLGNYAILDKLGSGGMGMVFKARHRRMERVVALKILPPALTREPDSLRRFQREVVAAARLTHANIVTAYDADEAKGLHFLVMEYVAGHDLATIVKRFGPLSTGQAVRCVLDAACGLEYAHRQAVVHRDIKPANLLLDRQQGRVKVLDMGLARLEHTGPAGVAASELTTSGTVMGTADFISPEQAVSTRNADERSDIYSLGMTLYYLITGKPAYQGDTMMSKLLAHRDHPIPSLLEQQPEAPESLDRIFRKMVAKKPEDRFQSMTEVIAELRAAAPVEPSGQLAVVDQVQEPDFSELLRQLDEEHMEAATRASLNSSTVDDDLETLVYEDDTQVPPPSAPAAPPSQRPISKRGLLVAAGLLAVLIVGGVFGRQYLNGTFLPFGGGRNDGKPPSHGDTGGGGRGSAANTPNHGKSGGSVSSGHNGKPSDAAVKAPVPPVEAPVPELAEAGPPRGTDLMPAARPLVESLAGWSADGKKLRAAPQPGAEAAPLPVGVIPPGAYELYVDFTLESGSHWDLDVPVAGRTVSLRLGTTAESSRRRLADDDETDGRVDADSPAEPRGRHRLTVHVDRAGDGAGITASLDGAGFVDWSGPADALRLPPTVSDSGFVLAPGKAAVVVHALRIRNRARQPLVIPRRVALLAGKRQPEAGAAVEASVSGDGTVAAVRYTNGAVRVFSLPDGRTQFHVPDVVERYPNRRIALSPDGKLLAALVRGGAIRLWTLPAGEQAGEVKLANASPNTIAIAPDGKTLAVGCRQGRIVICDVQTREETGELSGHAQDVLAVEFSSDGSRLASVSSDKTVRVWDTSEGRQRGLYRGLLDPGYSVSVSPDGKLVAAVERGGGLHVWDVETTEIYGDRNRWPADAACLAFSPDGKALAVGDGSLRTLLLDARAQTPETIIRSHATTAAVRSVAFTSDGGALLIATALRESYVEFWGLQRVEPDE